MNRPTPSTAKKLLLSAGLVLASVVYASTQQAAANTYVADTPGRNGPNRSSPGAAYRAANQELLHTIRQITDASSTAAASGPQTQNRMQAGMPANAGGMMMNNGQYKNGSYTGSAIDAYYGTVQVKAVIQGGKLADVQFLQYPNDRSNSVYINSQAMPLLTQEAIQAQSAQVNGVSGATFTSEAFIQSLSSALTQAKA